MDAKLREAVLLVAGLMERQIDAVTYYRNALCLGKNASGWCPNVAMSDGSLMGLGATFHDLVVAARARERWEAEKQEGE